MIRDLERESEKVKRGQPLADGVYLDESKNPIYPCQVIVKDGVVCYKNKHSVRPCGIATKTNIKEAIVKTKKYAIDSNKVFYHATWDKFSTFDLSKIKKQPGFWFTEDKDYASQHGNYLKRVYLDIKKPLNQEYDDDTFVSHYSKCFNSVDVKDELVFSKAFREYLISNNYDSLMWKHSGYYTVVVFYPEQIKVLSTTLITV